MAYPQSKIFEAAVQFARTEGILPAPEPAHAIRAVIDEALRCKEEGRSETIVFNLCGHGHFDLKAYEDHLSGPPRCLNRMGGRRGQARPGHFGVWGGRFVPEVLMAALDQLTGRSRTPSPTPPSTPSWTRCGGTTPAARPRCSVPGGCRRSWACGCG